MLIFARLVQIICDNLTHASFSSRLVCNYSFRQIYFLLSFITRAWSPACQKDCLHSHRGVLVVSCEWIAVEMPVKLSSLTSAGTSKDALAISIDILDQYPASANIQSNKSTRNFNWSNCYNDSAWSCQVDLSGVLVNLRFRDVGAAHYCALLHIFARIIV